MMFKSNSLQIPFKFCKHQDCLVHIVFLLWRFAAILTCANSSSVVGRQWLGMFPYNFFSLRRTAQHCLVLTTMLKIQFLRLIRKRSELCRALATGFNK